MNILPGNRDREPDRLNGEERKVRGRERETETAKEKWMKEERSPRPVI